MGLEGEGEWRVTGRVARGQGANPLACTTRRQSPRLSLSLSGHIAAASGSRCQQAGSQAGRAAKRRKWQPEKRFGLRVEDVREGKGKGGEGKGWEVAGRGGRELYIMRGRELGWDRGAEGVQGGRRGERGEGWEGGEGTGRDWTGGEEWRQGRNG